MTPRSTGSPLSPLEIVELKGEPLDIAYHLGIQRRRKIRRRVEYWERELARLYRGKSDERKEMERAFWRFSRRLAPAYLREIEAMAQGAGIPFEKMFRLNLTELNAFADKCTDLILPFVSKKGKRAILIAHNEDWNPRRNDVFLLKARLRDLEYVTLAYDGYLPGLSAGLNSHGLVHSVNYLNPRDKRLGLPRIFLARHLLTAKNFSEVLGLAEHASRAFGHSIHLAHGENYLNLELSARRKVLRRPRLPTVHTNHYLSVKLRSLEASKPVPSKRRWEVAMKILRENWPGPEIPSLPIARNLARRILSDRSGLPYAIWRMADSTLEPSATLAAAILCTSPAEWEIYRGPPLGTDPVIGKC